MADVGTTKLPPASSILGPSHRACNSGCGPHYTPKHPPHTQPADIVPDTRRSNLVLDENYLWESLALVIP